MTTSLVLGTMTKKMVCVNWVTKVITQTADVERQRKNNRDIQKPLIADF